MADKTISQLVSNEGVPTAPATSAPGCFIHDGAHIPQHPDMKWGEVFSDPRNGNHVDFYVTGTEYFNALTAAIAGARKSIHITGWQINFDVELQPGKTLYQVLEKAIDDNPDLHIYVMPWLSPKAGLDTGDFETMLAIFQLNAGLKPNGKIRAFAMPAIGQSDMSGGMGIFFSHHQKLVVIDDERAFLGGIDLAYGRRDDGRFTLAHEGRQGSEVYNTCVPPIEELSAVDQTGYLTRMELLFACFSGMREKGGTWWYSASGLPVAVMKDGAKILSDTKADITHRISDWWATGSLVPEFVDRAMDVPVDAAQDASRLAYRRLDAYLKGKLDRLRATGSAHAANSAAALLAWLNNASLDRLPSEARHGVVTLIESFMIDMMGQLAASAAKRPARYDNLAKLGKMVPKSGKVLAKSQPRMPWHDVHCSVMGPSVSDLSRNFSQRWNGMATRYRNAHARVTSSQDVKLLYYMLGLTPHTSKLSIPEVAPPRAASRHGKKGQCWVQVLRSAPVRMLRDELAAGNSRAAPSAPQNNCLKAMLAAIYGAQKFIYIEGQFFQAEYGADSRADSKTSGPMAALIDITSHPFYEKHARRLGIWGVAPEDIPVKIRWSQVDDVQRDVQGKGADFMNDLDAVLTNIALIKATRSLGRAQGHILNPIGEALARRIESAIYDGLPFHVYMVLPVYPEGTLNTLNIMTQVHLTMQSLVFGSSSLVNRIRRALVVRTVMIEKKVSVAEARRITASYNAAALEMAEVKWEKYLTCLISATGRCSKSGPSLNKYMYIANYWSRTIG